MQSGGQHTSPSTGTKVRRARVAGGYSLRGFAKLIGVSPATLSQIENDKARLSVERLEVIAAALDCSSSDILEARGAAAHAPPRLPADGMYDTRQDWRVYGPHHLPPILQAALAEFLEVGYHGTGMRKIAARCGVSVPSIYAHYPSKQDILMSILSLTMTDLEWRSDAALAEGDDPVSTFCLAIENLVLFHTYRRELGFIGASEVRALEPENREAITRRRGRQQALIDRCVRDAVHSGAFRVAEPEDAARAVVSMCTALPTWWQPDGRLSPPEVAVQFVQYSLQLMGCHNPPGSG